MPQRKKERRKVKEDGGGGGKLGQKQTRKFNVEITLVEGKKSKALSKGLFFQSKEGRRRVSLSLFPKCEMKGFGVNFDFSSKEKEETLHKTAQYVLTSSTYSCFAFSDMKFSFFGHGSDENGIL